MRISPRIFEKIRIGPNGILRGWGETDSGKKPEVENLATLSLYCSISVAGAHPSGSFSVSTVTHYSYGHQRQHGEEAEALPDLRLDQIKISLLQGKSNCIVVFS